MRGRFHIVAILAFPIMLAISILSIPVMSDHSNHILTKEQSARQHVGSGDI